VWQRLILFSSWFIVHRLAQLQPAMFNLIFFEIQLAMLKDRAWLILKTIGQSGTFADVLKTKLSH
jgi:hypothetical protein